MGGGGSCWGLGANTPICRQEMGWGRGAAAMGRGLDRGGASVGCCRKFGRQQAMPATLLGPSHMVIAYGGTALGSNRWLE